MDNLKERKITSQMLAECIFSVNKRAKNCRDKERKYRSYIYDCYNAEEQYKEKKLEYYRQKEILLSVLTPVCIHAENLGYARIRVYDYEPEYEKHISEFIWKNSYWDEELGVEVWFGDYIDKEHPLYKYYLFYEVGDYNFHIPIDKNILREYENLPVKDIGQLFTYGKQISELISTQFIKRVIELIQGKSYLLEIV